MSETRDSIIHKLTTKVAKPERFTFPFCYQPHPLAVCATEEVKKYVAENGLGEVLWHDGKMLGVLVVETENGQTAFLAAYSGQISGGYGWTDYFVPPVFDLTSPGGRFKLREAEISEMNRRVDELENGSVTSALRKSLLSATEKWQLRIEEYTRAMREAKLRRDQRRQEGQLTEAEREAMTRESQFQKAELRRMKKVAEGDIGPLQRRLDDILKEAEQLKQERKQMSDSLQRWLFDQYVMLNAEGETMTVTEIFDRFCHTLPPSGAGECCLPKLLQYAYQHRLRPVSMAEFWYGAPPRQQLRRHGCFYPACRSKCLPIMGHMLKGLSVDPDPLEADYTHDTLYIIYEDEWLAVVEKPSGMLSVAGKGSRKSVAELCRKMFPEAEEPRPAHRLDMDTSGLLVIAKTREAYIRMQQMFLRHEVRKTYVALLDGLLPDSMPHEGTISLPLRPDISDRPRQMVDLLHGKSAVTEYQVISQQGGRTLISLRPKTGRTHQLRVHCAHPDGLNTPIAGDSLYGKPSARLCLHASELTFRHPFTGENITLKSDMPF